MVKSGNVTSTLAVAVFPVPPSFEVTGSVVLTCVPPAIARTSIENVQLLPARMVPPTRLMLVTAGVITPGSQVPVRLSGLAMIRPAGSVSLKDTPVRSVAPLGFVIVNVKVTLVFSGALAAENDFVMEGGATTTAYTLVRLNCVAAPQTAKNANASRKSRRAIRRESLADRD